MLKAFPIYITHGVLEVMRAKGGLQSPTEAHHAKQLFLISYLTRKVLQEEDAKKRNGYINLNSADCQTLYGMSYKQIVFEPLKELGIMEVYEGYVPGVRSKGYRLTKPYRIEVEKGGLKEFTLAEAFQLKRIQRWEDKQFDKAIATYPSVEHQLQHLGQLTIDKEAIADELERLEQAGVYKGKELGLAQYRYIETEINHLIKLFDAGGFRASLKKGRVHHNLCNTPKLFRQHILDRDGMEMVEADMKSAQVFFLCVALLNYLELKPESILELKNHINRKVDLFNSKTPLPSDVYPFFANVVADDFYSDLHESRLGQNYSILATDQKLSKAHRDPLKDTALKVLFTNSEKHPSDAIGVRKKLYETYPTVMDFVHRYADAQLSTSRRSSGLSILLQEMEGYFFNGLVAPMLQDRFPDHDWFIIYDAVFCSQEIEEEVTEELRQLVKEQYGVEGLY